MIRLQFALWRRDVAIRKIAALRKQRWRSDRWERREAVLEQRARRWEMNAQIIIMRATLGMVDSATLAKNVFSEKIKKALEV